MLERVVCNRQGRTKKVLMQDYAEILRFRGKVDRRIYWAAGIILPIVWWFVGVIVAGVSIGYNGDLTGGALAIWVIWVLMIPTFLYLGAALTMARLRDAGLSLWWMLAWPLTAPIFWVVVGLWPPEEPGDGGK